MNWFSLLLFIWIAPALVLFVYLMWQVRRAGGRRGMPTAADPFAQASAGASELTAAELRSENAPGGG